MHLTDIFTKQDTHFIRSCITWQSKSLPWCFNSFFKNHLYNSKSKSQSICAYIWMPWRWLQKQWNVWYTMQPCPLVI